LRRLSSRKGSPVAPPGPLRRCLFMVLHFVPPCLPFLYHAITLFSPPMARKGSLSNDEWFRHRPPSPHPPSCRDWTFGAVRTTDEKSWCEAVAGTKRGPIPVLAPVRSLLMSTCMFSWIQVWRRGIRGLPRYLRGMRLLHHPKSGVEEATQRTGNVAP